MSSATRECPTCSKAVPADGRFRPFCSQRCKLVDLGRWLDGEYVVPGETVADFDVTIPPPDEDSA